jgi:calcium-dependent protein kinase
VQTVLACINYCHKRKIVHRDIKLENMLLEKTMKDQFDQIKVIDFGTSTTCAHDQKLEEKIGSPYYIAPEVLAK